jgi:hypothetical protein
MGTKPIHMEEDFSVTPEQIYGALLDGKQFRAITAQRSEIDPVPAELSASSTT